MVTSWSMAPPRSMAHSKVSVKEPFVVACCLTEPALGCGPDQAEPMAPPPLFASLQVRAPHFQTSKP
jgi:hypothetical protein